MSKGLEERKIKVLLLSRYFPPDIGTSANLFFDLASSLKRKGHEVTVVAGYPWYNLETIPKEFRKGFFKTDFNFGIKIIRVRMPIFRSVKINLAAGHVLAPLALLLGGLRCSNVEAIYVYSPPLLIGLAGRILAWKMKAILVLGVQDLHPQAYIDQGVLSNALLIRIFRSVEKWTYLFSDAITVHSEGNRQHVVGVVPSKLESVKVVPNWVDTTTVVPLPKRNSFSERLGLNEKFVVGYAGTIGLSQGVECIIDVAFALKEKKEIHFLLVGSGVEKTSIVKKSRGAGLDNITFLGMQPQEQYPYVVASFDVALVTLNSRVKTPVIPSKIISLMAAERPFVASLPEGDAADLVRLAGSGIVVPPDLPHKLLTAILRLYENPETRQLLGRSGRQYVEENLTAEDAAQSIQSIFTSAKKINEVISL